MIYVEASGFRPTNAGLTELPSLVAVAWGTLAARLTRSCWP
jgi:hypothetical protein